MNSLVRRFWRRSSLLSSLILLITISLLLAGFALPSFAQTPDPAGVATGDKTNVLDAAGNPFVMSEPMDKTAAASRSALSRQARTAARGRRWGRVVDL